MFTANSMNCLTEAIGLALPGNGSTLATHALRRTLFETAGRVVVDLARRWYDNDDASVLPRSVASRHAFENAMALDVAMGGSTNTVLHLLAAAREAGLDFGVADIDAVSRRVPCVAKVAPSSTYHMEDVHRAGGIPAILGELDRAGLLHRDVVTVHSRSFDDWLRTWDVRGGDPSPEAVELYHAAPGGVRTTEPFSTTNRWDRLDTDPAGGGQRRPHRAGRGGRPDRDRHPDPADAPRRTGRGAAGPKGRPGEAGPAVHPDRPAAPGLRGATRVCLDGDQRERRGVPQGSRVADRISGVTATGA